MNPLLYNSREFVEMHFKNKYVINYINRDEYHVASCTKTQFLSVIHSK